MCVCVCVCFLLSRWFRWFFTIIIIVVDDFVSLCFSPHFFTLIERIFVEWIRRIKKIIRASNSNRAYRTRMSLAKKQSERQNLKKRIFQQPITMKKSRKQIQRIWFMPKRHFPKEIQLILRWEHHIHLSLEFLLNLDKSFVCKLIMKSKKCTVSCLQLIEYHHEWKEEEENKYIGLLRTMIFFFMFE